MSLGAPPERMQFCVRHGDGTHCDHPEGEINAVKRGHGRLCIQLNVWREVPGQCSRCGFSDPTRGHTCPDDGPWERRPWRPAVRVWDAPVPVHPEVPGEQ